MDEFSEQSSNPIKREIRNSLELWPDPFEAPDVPGRETLRLYLESPSLLAEGLFAQISESIHCQRALEFLAEGDEVPEREDTWLTTAAHDIIAHQSTSTPITESPPASPIPDRFPEPGLLFSTKSEVDFWDGEKLTIRRTYHPLTVLILTPEITLPWKDAIFRAVACTPADFWPQDWRAEDEILISTSDGREYIAHLWLEYPVSLSQLEGLIGELSDIPLQEDGSLDLTSFSSAGESLHPLLDASIFLERDRLHERAAFLGATAQARRLAHEAGASPNESPLEELLTEVSEQMGQERWLQTVAEYEAEPPFLLAAQTQEPMTRVSVIELAELEKWAAQLEAREVKESEPHTQIGAKLIDPPQPDPDFPGKGYILWELTSMVRGCRDFAVIDKKTGTIIGSGKLRDNEPFAMVRADWNLLKPYAENPTARQNMTLLLIRKGDS